MKLLHKNVNGVKVWFIFFAIVACLVLIAFLLETPRFVRSIPFMKSDGTSEITTGNLRIDGVNFNITVADTGAERRLGLSGRKTLGAREGMLFIFNDNDQHGIWMKEMNFPIDILWVSESFRIVDIERNVSPNSYPEVFTSSKPSSYVLELPAGSIDSYSFNGLSKIEINLLER